MAIIKVRHTAGCVDNIPVRSHLEITSVQDTPYFYAKDRVHTRMYSLIEEKPHSREVFQVGAIYRVEAFTTRPHGDTWIDLELVVMAGGSVPATEHTHSVLDGSAHSHSYQGLSASEVKSKIDTYKTDQWKDYPQRDSVKEISIMQGFVYTGSVVRTKTVAAGEGVTTGLQVSEVAYTVSKPFVAINDDTARALILAEAAVNKVDINNPIQPVEVKLVKAS